VNTNLQNGKLVVSIKDAGELLSISRTTVSKLLDAGDLKAVRVRHSVRITMESIRAVAGAGTAGA